MGCRLDGVLVYGGAWVVGHRSVLGRLWAAGTAGGPRGTTRWRVRAWLLRHRSHGSHRRIPRRRRLLNVTPAHSPSQAKPGGGQAEGGLLAAFRGFSFVP